MDSAGRKAAVSNFSSQMEYLGTGIEGAFGDCYTNGYSLQPTCAQSRMPMDRIVSGACVSFFHASHAASTMAS